MKKINYLKNVWKLICVNSINEIFFINDNKLFVKSNQYENLIVFNNFKCEIIELWREGFLINEDFYYEENFSDYLFEKNIYKQLIINKSELIIKKIDFINEIVLFGNFNYETRQVNWFKEDFIPPFFLLTETSFLAKFNNQFSCITNCDNEIWQLNLEDLVQSTTINTYPELYLSNDKIYFYLSSNNRKGLFCIDVNTGKELFLYSDCFGFLVQDENFIYSSKFNNVLCIINTLTNEYLEWNVDALIKENGFESIHDHRCFAKDGLVYFTQTLGDIKSKIGILNPSTKELIWKYEFEPNNGAIGSIQVNGDRLYVHTQDQTLHIFENE